MGLSPRVPDFNLRKNVTPQFGVDGHLNGTERVGFLGQGHMVMLQGGDYFKVGGWAFGLVLSTPLPFIWRSPVLLSSSCKCSLERKLSKFPSLCRPGQAAVSSVGVGTEACVPAQNHRPCCVPSVTPLPCASPAPTFMCLLIRSACNENLLFATDCGRCWEG